MQLDHREVIKTKKSGTSDQLKSRYSKQLKATNAIAKTQRKYRNIEKNIDATAM